MYIFFHYPKVYPLKYVQNKNEKGGKKKHIEVIFTQVNQSDSRFAQDFSL